MLCSRHLVCRHNCTHSSGAPSLAANRQFEVAQGLPDDGIVQEAAEQASSNKQQLTRTMRRTGNNRGTPIEETVKSHENVAIRDLSPLFRDQPAPHWDHDVDSR